MNTRPTIPTSDTLLHPGTAVALWALLVSGEVQALSGTATGSNASVTGPERRTVVRCGSCTSSGSQTSVTGARARAAA
jgi:hypothetical protein